MLRMWQAAVMGLVQGLTEFLPVSSKTHLLFASHFLHLYLTDTQNVSFDIIIHVATLLAVVIYFRKDIAALLKGLGRLIIKPAVWKDDAMARLAVYLLIGTIPGAVLGFLLEKKIGETLINVPLSGVGLFFTAAFLYWISRRPAGGKLVTKVKWLDALIIGCCQAVALLPGISRSGATITGSLWRGLDRDAAPRFSFLLAVPIILGGGVKEALEVHAYGLALPKGPLVVAFIVAAISGYFAIMLLLDSVRKGKLAYFAFYCAALGAAMLIYWFTLVPMLDTSRFIATDAKLKATVATYQDDELTSVELGQQITFHIVAKPGNLPVTSATILFPEPPQKKVKGVKRVANPSLPVHLTLQKDGSLENTKPYKVDLSGSEQVVPDGGEDRDMMVILHSSIGVENEIPLKMRVMPESLNRRRV